MIDRTGVVLVGHGGIPSDYPRESFLRLRALESERRRAGTPPSVEERALERQLRQWPRTPETDPYQAAVEELARHLRALLDGSPLALAYNEFCSPTVEEAVVEMVQRGAPRIVVIPSMLTPGGSHAERDIPDSLARVRARHPDLDIRYAWPFDLGLVSSMLVEQIRRFDHGIMRPLRWMV